MPTQATISLGSAWTKIADAGVEFSASTRSPNGLWSIAFVATDVAPAADVDGHLVGGAPSIASRQAFAEATGFVYARAENSPAGGTIALAVTI